ncbi:hypothetical protein [Saccharomonospora iraqiensis]|uniref:hypothetical protein n=1 Tax=Saccharomonospora iraqiensis TaxID=52698 RepID=UPI00022E4CE2|nr:hypothetical protein [Saccharomonospora iraqiensis]
MPTYEDPELTKDSSGPISEGAGAIFGAMGGGQVAEMASEAKKMVSSAESGGFMVSEDAGQPIRDTLARMQERVRTTILEFENLSRTEPPLGEHSYGREVARRQREVLADEIGSPLMMLRELTGVIEDADRALDIAMAKYREVESSTSNSFDLGQS